MMLRPVPLSLRALLAVGALAASASCAASATADRPSPTDAAAVHAEIAAMMAGSAAAWNRGDLDAFMEDYVPGMRTTFVGSSGLLRGPEQLKERYRTRYFAPGMPRDSLSFEQLAVDPLAPGIAYVSAWYVLMRRDSVVARGPTTLVMVKQAGRWRILHDHSS